MSVGLDIGSKTIKVIELAPEKEKWRLLASGIVAYEGIDPQAVEKKEEIESLVVIIKKLFKEAAVSSRQISLAIPEALVYTRVVKFPLLTDQEIISAIKWEAEQYIPIPVGEAIIQHTILERRETATPPEVAVLLIAAPKTAIEKYVATVEAAGLTVVGVETDLLALTRVLAPDVGSALILDFGAKSTDIAITKAGKLYFSRSLHIGGEAFTRAIAQGLGIDNLRAEEYKKTYGLSHLSLEGKIKKVLDPVVKMVIDEVKKAAHFYEFEEGGEAPQAIILSGGSAVMPEVLATFSKLLNAEVVLANPFAKVAVDPGMVANLKPYAPIYSIAVGLAMRND